MKKPIIIAHRGGFGPHKENTLPAFTHALNHGVRALEMDVRFDYFHKRFYLEHDFFHHPKCRLNVIEGILCEIPKDILLVVELKIARCFSSRFYVRNFVKLYNDELKGRPILIQSFNPFALSLLRRHLPEAELGFLCGNPFWDIIFKLFFSRIRPQSYQLHRRMFCKSTVDYGRKHKLKIIPFVLNKPKDWDKALDFDVDAIITDVPEKLAEYLHSS